MKFFLLAAMLLCPVLAPSQLAVSVLPVQVIGQKAVVQLSTAGSLPAGWLASTVAQAQERMGNMNSD